MIDYLDKMDKFYNTLSTKKKDIPRNEQLKKQIEDYEIFVKYLYFYIEDIQLRIRRLKDSYEKEMGKKNK